MIKTMRIMSGASPFAMTAAERAAGRYMKAPDHDAGTAGDAGGNGGGDAGNGQGDGAGSSAANAGGGGAGAPADQGGNAGDNKPGGNGGDGSSILGDAARGDGSGSDGQQGDKEGEAGTGEGEGPRLTFGEGEAAAEILGAPETYELTAPEGMTFDKEAFEAVEGVLKDLNLSNAAAQAVVNAYAEKLVPLMEQRARLAGETLGADMRREWAQQAEREFDGKEGRPTLTEAKALARQAFLKFGVAGKEDDPFLQLLDDSGLGSHPVMVRTIAMIGKAVGEGTVEVNTGGGAKPRLADRIYGQPIKPA